MTLLRQLNPAAERITRQSSASGLVTLIGISGAINIASEAIWHRLISAILGDYYVTYAVVSCTFIIGAAVGSLFGAALPRWVWLLEAVPAAWSLLWALLIANGILYHSLSSYLGLAILIIPAFALGAHIPIYTSLVSKRRFAWISALYNLGGAVGLALLGVFVAQQLSLPVQMAILATCQAVAAVYLFLRRRDLRNPGIYFPKVVMLRISSYEAAAFVVGVTGFWWTMCVLSEAVFLSYPVRPVQFASFLTTIIWIGIGGSLSRYVTRRNVAVLAIIFPASTLAALFGGKLLAAQILPQGDVGFFFLAITAVSLVLTAPIVLTSAWYGFASDQLAKTAGQAWAGGRIWAAAGIGNAIGCLAALKFGEDLVAVLMASAAAAILLSAGKPRFNLRYTAVAGLSCALVLCHWVLLRQGIWRDLSARNAAIAATGSPTNWSEVHHTGLSWYALEFLQGSLTTAGGLKFTIDGHQSHRITAGNEYIVGMAAAAYFDHLGIRRSLVIGLGSGQSAWAAAHIAATGADIVEISPGAKAAAARLAEWNGDILKDTKAHVIWADGLTVLRHCAPGEYDLILNTSTPPSLMNSAKLYDAEFVSAVKNCLSSQGVYVTYFDDTSADTKSEIDFLLSPIAKRFSHIDIATYPYPIVIAYQGPKRYARNSLYAGMLDTPDAKQFVLSRGKHIFRDWSGKEKTWIRMWPIRDFQATNPPDAESGEPTLSDGRLEAVALGNYLRGYMPKGVDGSFYERLAKEAGNNGDSTAP